MNGGAIFLDLSQRNKVCYLEIEQFSVIEYFQIAAVFVNGFSARGGWRYPMNEGDVIWTNQIFYSKLFTASCCEGKTCRCRCMDIIDEQTLTHLILKNICPN